MASVPPSNVTREFWEASAVSVDQAEPLTDQPAFTEAEYARIFMPAPYEELEEEFDSEAFNQIRWRACER